MDLIVFLDEAVSVKLTPTLRRVLGIVSLHDQLPPGRYSGTASDIMSDYTGIENRLLAAGPHSYKRPKNQKDVPFWCKRR